MNNFNCLISKNLQNKSTFKLTLMLANHNNGIRFLIISFFNLLKSFNEYSQIFANV